MVEGDGLENRIPKGTWVRILPPPLLASGATRRARFSRRRLETRWTLGTVPRSRSYPWPVRILGRVLTTHNDGPCRPISGTARGPCSRPSRGEMIPKEGKRGREDSPIAAVVKGRGFCPAPSPLGRGLG